LGFDDGIFAAAKIVEFLSNSNQTMSGALAEFPSYFNSPEIKALCPDSKKYGVIDKIQEDFAGIYPADRINTINGVKVYMDGGWGLVRASSNLPELSLTFEAKSMESLRNIRKVFKDKVDEFPEVNPEWENDMVF